MRAGEIAQIGNGRLRCSGASVYESIADVPTAATGTCPLLLEMTMRARSINTSHVMSRRLDAAGLTGARANSADPHPLSLGFVMLALLALGLAQPFVEQRIRGSASQCRMPAR